jgi:hypothetical protein
MNTAGPTSTIPFALTYSAPASSPMRWLAGGASMGLAIASVGLSAVGRGALGGGIGEAWAGAMFVVVAVAATITGLFCGASDAVFGKGDRTLSVLGSLCNVLAAGVVWAMWM